MTACILLKPVRRTNNVLVLPFHPLQSDQHLGQSPLPSPLRQQALLPNTKKKKIGFTITSSNVSWTNYNPCLTVLSSGRKKNWCMCSMHQTMQLKKAATEEMYKQWMKELMSVQILEQVKEVKVTKRAKKPRTEFNHAAFRGRTVGSIVWALICLSSLFSLTS